MASVVIIDYGSGNLRSVAKAFEAVASNVVVSDDSRMLENASHIVLPGVGAFGDCMSGLSALPGMLENLNEQVRVHRKYFLGICVGMQMLFENGYENGIHKGLGWLGGDVIPLPKSGIKIPHMGWNNLEIKKKSELLKEINNGDYAYFVHSYYAKPTDNSVVMATAGYGVDVTAIIAKDNIFGAQFHPEKSQKTGLKILENFVRL